MGTKIEELNDKQLVEIIDRAKSAAAEAHLRYSQAYIEWQKEEKRVQILTTMYAERKITIVKPKLESQPRRRKTTKVETDTNEDNTTKLAKMLKSMTFEEVKALMDKMKK